jgi:uncharacterized protein YigA (DUF484 family)
VSDTQLDALSAELVADYLRDNPDFFVNHPELVERLHVPHHQAGTISLVQVQLNRQRQRIEELEEEITALMSLAATNDRTFHTFMDLQEQMLKCRSLLDVVRAIELKALDLNLKAHIRLLNAPVDEYQLDKEHWQRFALNHFNGKQAYLGRMRKSDRNGLFGENSFAPEMGSYVVLPLNRDGIQGVLAFSSEDGGHFQPCMDTLFLRHLAVVFSHLIDTLSWHAER